MAQKLSFNESPGPAMANPQWDDVKDLIIDLYKYQKKPLREVREVMSSRYGFVRK